MAATQTIKAGTRIRFYGRGRIDATDELGTVKRWDVRINGPRENVPGYHRVRFDGDNGDLLVHEGGFEVVK